MIASGVSLPPSTDRGSSFKLLKEGCDGEVVDRFDVMKAKEIVVAAHELSDAGGHRAGNELGIVRVASVGNVRWDRSHRFNEGDQLFFQ